MSDDAIPEADRLEGAPHPRNTVRLHGHRDAETEILDALTGERMHHAWLLTGPRGIGKATLAWRMAKFLLAKAPADAGLFGEPERPERLDVDQDHPVSRRIAALSEPGCHLIRRSWDPDRKRLRAQITVDDVRKLNAFFGLSAAEGGHRVVIVDSADEMNPSAANALLKVLEEPPKGAVLILVSHQPARLLPTIRSRCRVLRLRELNPDDMADALAGAGYQTGASPGLFEMARGSVGDAIRFLDDGGLEHYATLVGLIGKAPAMDRQALAGFVESVTARGADAKLDLTVRLIDIALARLAHAAAGRPSETEAVPGERTAFAHLAEHARAVDWADLHQRISARIAHGLAVNVDPNSLLTDAFLKINETARP